jgi:hypothetical protein
MNLTKIRADFARLFVTIISNYNAKLFQIKMNLPLGRNPHPLFQVGTTPSSAPELIPIKDALDKDFVRVGFWSFSILNMLTIGILLLN